MPIVSPIIINGPAAPNSMIVGGVGTIGPAMGFILNDRIPIIYHITISSVFMAFDTTLSHAEYFNQPYDIIVPNTAEIQPQLKVKVPAGTIGYVRRSGLY